MAKTNKQNKKTFKQMKLPVHLQPPSYMGVGGLTYLVPFYFMFICPLVGLIFTNLKASIILGKKRIKQMSSLDVIENTRLIYCTLCRKPPCQIQIYQLKKN